MSTALHDRAAELASTARLASGWWSRPLPDEVAAWERSWPAAKEAALVLGVDPDVVDELSAALADTGGDDVLLDEYERLFVGPGRVPCQPYESVWRDDRPRRERGTLMGTVTRDVAGLYRQLGLHVQADSHELPDHVAVEWEALAFALETDADDVATALVERHLAVWLPSFCAAVEGHTGEPFYRELAKLTGFWISGLVEACAE